MDNVIEFPADKPPPLFVGPFTHNRVVVQGRLVPNLTGAARSDGKFELYVDGRFGGTFSTEDDARQAAWLIAQAMAIASGYPHFEADSKGMPFAKIAVQIAEIPAGDANG